MFQEVDNDVAHCSKNLPLDLRTRDGRANGAMSPLSDFNCRLSRHGEKIFGNLSYGGHAENCSSDDSDMSRASMNTVIRGQGNNAINHVDKNETDNTDLFNYGNTYPPNRLHTLPSFQSAFPNLGFDTRLRNGHDQHGNNQTLADLDASGRDLGQSNQSSNFDQGPGYLPSSGPNKTRFYNQATIDENGSARLTANPNGDCIASDFYTIINECIHELDISMGSGPATNLLSTCFMYLEEMRNEIKNGVVNFNKNTLDNGHVNHSSTFCEINQRQEYDYQCRQPTTASGGPSGSADQGNSQETLNEDASRPGQPIENDNSATCHDVE